MAINFPDSPTVNQTYAVGDRTWTWTGATWDALGQPAVPTTNAIINGAFDIWQRGTSFSNPGSGSYTADRVRIFHDGTGATRTVSKQTFTPGSAPVAGYEAEAFFRYSVTAAGSGNTFNVFDFPLEDVRTLAGQTVTLSFFAKSAAPLTLSEIGRVQDFGSGGSGGVGGGFATSVAITTSWTRYTYTGTIPSISGKTIGSGSNLYFRFVLPSNTTFTFDIWGVQLEAGSVATPFKRNAPSIQAELAACQRYYLRSAVTTGGAVHGSYGAAYSTTNALIPLPSHNTMRVVPTSIEWTNVQLSDGVGGYPATGITVWGSSTPDSPYANVTVSSGLTQFRPYYISSQNSASASYVGFSAEL